MSQEKIKTTLEKGKLFASLSIQYASSKFNDMFI